MWRKGKPPTLLMGMHTGTATGRIVSRFLEKLKTELPYDPTIPILGLYPEKSMVQKHTCIPVFTAALLTIAKTWKQP